MRRWQDEYLLASIPTATYRTGFSQIPDVTPDQFMFTHRPGESFAPRTPNSGTAMTRDQVATVFRALAVRKKTT